MSWRKECPLGQSGEGTGRLEVRGIRGKRGMVFVDTEGEASGL